MARSCDIEKCPEELVPYKNWYEVRVEGKILGVLPPSKESEMEVLRLKGLEGITVSPASPEKLIEINAKTLIPYRLFSRWEKAFRKMLKRQK